MNSSTGSSSTSQTSTATCLCACPRRRACRQHAETLPQAVPKIVTKRVNTKVKPPAGAIEKTATSLTTTTTMPTATAAVAGNLIAQVLNDVSAPLNLPTTGAAEASAVVDDFPTVAAVGKRNADASKTIFVKKAKAQAMAKGTPTSAPTRAPPPPSSTSQLTKMKKITTTKPAPAITKSTTPKTTTKATAPTSASVVSTKAQAKRNCPVAQKSTTRTPANVNGKATLAAAAAAVTATVIATTTTATAKTKSTQNKCPLAALTNVSNQRQVERNTTLPIAHANVEREQKPTVPLLATLAAHPTWIPPPATEYAHSIQPPATAENLKRITCNLAARKAKLKADFFGLSSSSSSTACAQNSSSTPKRFCNAIAHIPVLPPVALHVTDPTDVSQSASSLVVQRQQDLKRKFAETTAAQRQQPPTITFPRVESLVQQFDRKMIVNANKSPEERSTNANMLALKPDSLEQRHSPLSDEGCTIGQSPYSSDNEDNESIRTTSTTVERCKRKEKVARSASSDSALGLDVDDSMDTEPPTSSPQRRMTLTVTDLPLRPALLPLAEPTALLDSPTLDVQNPSSTPAQSVIPSKVLLEERVVELPEEPRVPGPSLSSSRRESAQSCTSDFTATEFPTGKRFVRTPSVVVSDYSDEVMCGITLEEIEYFRAQRMRRRYSSLDTANEGDGQSDVSASSSCSNLYYCGSTISALDGAECIVNGVRTALERKTSDCSTGSASADEDGFAIPEDADLADLLAAQHLSAKQPKKVGLLVPQYGEVGARAEYPRESMD